MVNKKKSLVKEQFDQISQSDDSQADEPYQDITIEIVQNGISLSFEDKSVFFSALNADAIGAKLLLTLKDLLKEVKNKRVKQGNSVTYHKIDFDV